MENNTVVQQHCNKN